MKKEEEIKNLFKQLTASRKQSLLQSLETETQLEKSIEKLLIKEESENSIKCPHCHSDKINGWGKQNGKKRYKCKKCGKTFNALTGTSMSYIKYQEKFIKYLTHIINNSTIREAAKDLNINIATSFNWRHKILSSLKDENESTLKGIIEADETFFLLSEKGSKNLNRKARKRGGKAQKPGTSLEQVNVLVTTDRQKNKYFALSNLGRIASSDIERILKNSINKESIVCSDANKAYVKWCKEKQLKHYPLNISIKQYIREKVYHIQHVNSDIKIFKEWIEYKFHGVATRYLQNYLNWNRFKIKLKKQIDKDAQWVEQIIHNKNAKIKSKTNYIRFETLVDELYYPLFSKT